MGGGLESCCVGRVYGADGAVHGTIRTINTTGYNNCINWLPTLHFTTYVSVLISVPDVLSCNPKTETSR